MLGRILAGKYHIQSLLGEGAMGRVYQAAHVDGGEPAAIKVLHQHLALDPRVAKRFHREARTASRFTHPNSVKIQGFGEDEDGTLYIAMELLPGRDMLTLIEEEGPLTPGRVIRLLSDSLEALGAAHKNGIVHRDFKPENVLINTSESGEDHIKVCDFGIAKIAEADGGSAITVSGFVCGTPEYMAPEQARGEEIDERTDIYAAGCMLYQLLTGQVPFSGDTPLGIITQHLTEYATSATKRAPELRIPVGLSRIAERAMAKEARYRYPNAKSMLTALESVSRSLGDLAELPPGQMQDDPTTDVNVAPVGAPRLPRRRKARAGRPLISNASLALVILAVGFALGALLMFTPAAAPETTVAAVAEPRPTTAPEAPEASTPTEQNEAVIADAAPQTSSPNTVRASEQGASDQPTEAPPQRRRPRPRTPRQDENDESRASAQATMSAESTTTSPTNAYAEGRRLFLANDLSGAIRNFERAARQSPNSARVQKDLGRAYMRSGQVAQGRRAYRRYLELAPNAPDRPIVERLIGR